MPISRRRVWLQSDGLASVSVSRPRRRVCSLAYQTGIQRRPLSVRCGIWRRPLSVQLRPAPPPPVRPPHPSVLHTRPPVTPRPSASPVRPALGGPRPGGDEFVADRNREGASPVRSRQEQASARSGMAPGGRSTALGAHLICIPWAVGTVQNHVTSSDIPSWSGQVEDGDSCRPWRMGA